MRYLLALIIIILLLFFSHVPAREPAGNVKRVILEQANRMEGDEEKYGKNVQALFGDVRLRHETTLMFCDSAFIQKDSNNVDAFGSIHIIQDDSIHLYGKELFYIGNIGLAKVRKDVRLVSDSTVLTTEFLDYDRYDDVAYYFNGGTITNGPNILESNWGYFFPKMNLAQFKTDVVVTNPDYVIYSDTMIYNTLTEIVTIVGPTTIISDQNVIYAEAGFYNTKTDKAQLEKNNSVTTDEQILLGDTIFYDRKTGFGEVFSNMSLTDTTNNVKITGDYGYYNELSKQALATKRAVLYQIHQGDTLFLHADTLRIDSIPGLDHKLIRAYHAVKYFRIDIQGRCDSMVFDMADSINYMYHDPIMWSQDNQMTAEIIKLHTRNHQLYKAELINSSFVISREDTIHFNQIKGKLITGFIRDNELYRIEVDGNGQTVYYPKDDDIMIGVNRTESSNITILLEERQVTGITTRVQPTGNLNPMFVLPLEEQKLDGFRWLEDYRPKKPDDIFVRDEPPPPEKRTNYSDYFFDKTLNEN
ncbi:MAG: organic solvent tolerance protein OstA [Marinilabiliaceae bacterium]|nr:organic solvent tolerance protein OstA [Marinilabiliaceae bacterium]